MPITKAVPETVQSLDDLLDAAAVSAPKAKKSDTPAVRSDVLDEKLKRLVEAKRLAKDLDAEIKLIAADCQPEAERLRLDYCRQTGSAASSIKINGVTFVVQNKYSKIPLSEAEGLQARFNGKTETYFTKQSEVKVDVTKLTPEALKALLLCGAATVERFFKPTDAFHTDATLDPNVHALAEAAGIRAVQYFKE